VKKSLGVLGLCNCEFVFLRAFVCVCEVFVCVCEVFVVVYVSMVVILNVDSVFWLALPVDVGLRLTNHVKYCCLM
jgi:hypothetical protein